MLILHDLKACKNMFSVEDGQDYVPKDRFGNVIRDNFAEDLGETPRPDLADSEEEERGATSGTETSRSMDGETDRDDEDDEDDEDEDDGDVAKKRWMKAKNAAVAARRLKRAERLSARNKSESGDESGQESGRSGQASARWKSAGSKIKVPTAIRSKTSPTPI